MFDDGQNNPSQSRGAPLLLVTTAVMVLPMILALSDGKPNEQRCNAARTLTRPPVIVGPSGQEPDQPCRCSAALRTAVVAGHWASTRAAAPDTCGVAIDVPLKNAYPLFGTVDKTATPGAPRCTEAAP